MGSRYNHLRLRRNGAALLLLILPSTGAIASQIDLSFPNRGTYRVWVATTFPPAPYAPTEVNSGQIRLEVPEAIAGDRVFVWSVNDRRVASKLVKDIGDRWSVRKSEFDRIAYVDFVFPQSFDSAGYTFFQDGVESPLERFDSVLRTYNVRPGEASIRRLATRTEIPVIVTPETERVQVNPSNARELSRSSILRDVFWWVITLGGASLAAWVMLVIVRKSRRPEPVASRTVATSSVRLISQDGSELIIEEGKHTVGRGDSCGIILAGESSVSRQHATIEIVKGTMIVTDDASTNGTFVNGVRITQPTTIAKGDTVTFGKAEFRVAG